MNVHSSHNYHNQHNSFKDKKRRARKKKVTKKAASVVSDEEMEEVAVRARNEKGHYIKDDPDTPENEAWTTKMVKKVKGTKNIGGLSIMFPFCRLKHYKLSRKRIIET